MDYKAIEQKWNKIWQENNLDAFDKSKADKKYYVLEMFSYPSGANLHLGHWYNYGPTDSFARFKRMQGYEVFQPMGFDAFGLPAENYAIKTGIHPKDSTMKNIATMEKQLKMMQIILYLYKNAQGLVAASIPISRILDLGLFDKVSRIKYDVPNDRLEMLDAYFAEIDQAAKSLAN